MEYNKDYIEMIESAIKLHKICASMENCWKCPFGHIFKDNDDDMFSYCELVNLGAPQQWNYLLDAVLSSAIETKQRELKETIISPQDVKQ